MKIKSIIMAALLVVCWASAAQAAGPYVAVGIGGTMLDDMTLTDPFDPAPLTIKSDTGFNVSGALGYDFGLVRTELEVNYRENDASEATYLGITLPVTGTTSAIGVMANLYLDIINPSPITPYVMIGGGYANVEIDDGFSTTDDDVFAYQVGAGVAFTIVPALMKLDLGYRFFATEDPNFLGTKGEYQTHNINLGLRITF